MSTGEVACIGEDFKEAFLKSLVSVGFDITPRSVLLSTGPIESKAEFMGSARALNDMDLKLYATQGTADFLASNGVIAEVLHWPLSDREPNVLSAIEKGQIDLAINIPKNIETVELENDYLIRRKAVDFGVPLITNLQVAKRFVEAISTTSSEDLKVRGWDQYK
jgi:carbamoyl-phosphate synthase large subunit